MVDSTPDTHAHMVLVRTFMEHLALELQQRAWDHDRSKLEVPEKAGYDILRARLDGVASGSPAYREAFMVPEVQAAIAHHYQVNRHHPEHWPRGIDAMTLVDLLEMFCDWKASSMRSQSSLIPSLAGSRDRFQMTVQLHRIFENTCKEYGW